MSRTSSPVGVRPAGPADAAAVGGIQARLWRAAYARDLPEEALAACTEQAFTAAWRDALTAPPGPDHVLLVAYDGGEIVGFAALSPADDPDLAGQAVLEVTVAGVDPRRRRLGHGSRLLAAAADLARERATSSLITWVLVAHEETRAFLQGAGFGPDRARRERVVDPAGRTVHEARLVAALPGSPEPQAR